MVKADNGTDAFGNKRMSYKAFATMMTNVRIQPENKNCVTLAKWMMGDACTNGKPNFSVPNVVACDDKHD